MELRYGHLSDEIYETYYYLAKAYYHYGKDETELITEGEDSNKGDAKNTGTESKTESCTAMSTGTEAKQSDEANQDESDDEEVDSKDVETYLQLSYETIECAKLVLKRQLQEGKFKESEVEQKMADCCDIVADIYMEEGVIAEAIEEYEKSLALRQKHASSGDRSVAETFFNLGMAFMVEQRFKEAETNYGKCKSIMGQCLSAALAKGEDSKQLTEIIAELEEKMAECQENEADYILAKESIQEFIKIPGSNKPLTDVTHLVKRKKPSSQPEATEDQPRDKMPKLQEKEGGEDINK